MILLYMINQSIWLGLLDKQKALLLSACIVKLTKGVSLCPSLVGPGKSKDTYSQEMFSIFTVFHILV